MDWKITARKLENVDTTEFGDIDLYIVYLSDHNDRPVSAKLTSDIYAVRKEMRNYITEGLQYSVESGDRTTNIEYDQDFVYETTSV